MRERKLILVGLCMLAMEFLGRAQESVEGQPEPDELSYEEGAINEALSDDALSDDALSDDPLSDETDLEAPPNVRDPRLGNPMLPQESTQELPNMDGGNGYLRGQPLDGVAPDSRLQGGPERRLWRINPQPFARLTYDDNIFISNTNRIADLIWTAGLTVSFELGDFHDLKDNYLIAEWSGAGLLYTDNPSQNAFNQSANLVGSYHWQRLTAEIESRYQYLTGPDRQIGNVASRQLIVNALHLKYDLSGKIRLTADARQSAQLYQIYLDQYEYQVKAGLDYQIFPKLGLGVEGVAGVLRVQESPDQTYQQLRIRGGYSLTGKIDIKFSGGLEFREVDDGQPLKTYPAFSLSLNYRPFDGTLISVEGYRTVFGSSSAIGQNFIATGFEVSIRQRIFQRITVTTAFGYENDDYFGTSQASQTKRVDNYFFIRPAISYALTRHAAFGIFYEFRRNESNQLVNTFFNNRAGLEFSMQL
ncbi:MAG TPA: outer membrane beta-barrel protein [Terrimicrobiaceae bacterium]